MPRWCHSVRDADSRRVSPSWEPTWAGTCQGSPRWPTKRWISTQIQTTTRDVPTGLQDTVDVCPCQVLLPRSRSPTDLENHRVQGSDAPCLPFPRVTSRPSFGDLRECRCWLGTSGTQLRECTSSQRKPLQIPPYPLSRLVASGTIVAALDDGRSCTQAPKRTTNSTSYDPIPQVRRSRLPLPLLAFRLFTFMLQADPSPSITGPHEWSIA